MNVLVAAVMSPVDDHCGQEIDQDGDLVLQRRPRHVNREDAEVVLSEVHLECLAGTNFSVTSFHCDGEELEIEHGLATPLALVGLQVWRGALLLGDYILHARLRFAGCVALELGAGPGVAGLLAARFARLVFLTDVGLLTLQNCLANAQRNASRLPLHGAVAVRVRQLDWTDPPDWLALPEQGAGSGMGPAPAEAPGPAAASQPEQPQDGCGSHCGQGMSTAFIAQQQGVQGRPPPTGEPPPPPPPLSGDPGPFGWQPGDVAELRDLRYILAADCIYDNDLTEALMLIAVQLMRLARRQWPQQERELQQEHQQEQQQRGLAPGGQAAGAGSSAAHSAGPSPPLLLVALERRIAFTLHDLDVRAPAYDFWRTLFMEVPTGCCTGCCPMAAGAARGMAAAEEAGVPIGLAGGPGVSWQPALGPCEPACRKTQFPLVGRKLDVASIPQLVGNYDRGEYLEMWELWLDE